MKLATLLVAMLIALPIAAVAQAPVIQGVFSPATLAPPVSPGMPVLVNGANLASKGAECPATRVGLVCGGVSATVNGRATPIRSAYPTQVITYIPTDLAPGTASVVVTNDSGASSAPFSVRVERYAPGIQNVSTSPGSVLGFFTDSSQSIISRSHPASPGEMLTVYAVGLGPTATMIPAGEVGVAPATMLPSLWIGNRTLGALSSGLRCGAICDPGVYLVDFVLPSDVPSGDQPVTLEIAGLRSNVATLVVGVATSTVAVGYLQSALDPRVRTMAPGTLANVVGGGFLSSYGGMGQCGTEPNYWPTTCLGITVKINDRAAPIGWLNASAITIQIPIELSAGPATLVVERVSSGQTIRSTPLQFTLDTYAPTLPASASSPYPGVVVQGSGGPVSATNPLLPGDDIFIYASGLGQTNPPLVSGFGLLQPARTTAQPTVTVGGKQLQNVFAEVLPGSIAQYRIGAHVPAGLGSGDLPIVVEIGGKRSQDGLLVPVSQDPVIGAVVSAASGTAEIASGSWVSIYGRNLSATTRQWREDDFVYDWMPTALDGVEVAINGVAAVVAYVSPMQLNVLAPDDLPPGKITVTVKSPLGWQKSSVTVKAYAPGLLSLPSPPAMIYVMAAHTDWVLVAPPGLLPPTVASRPAEPGETIILYGTGFGPTTPAVSAYHRFAGSAPLAAPEKLRVQIGGAAAAVTYAGLVGNGLCQINVVVPELPEGDHEVIASMGVDTSPRGRYIRVRR